MDVINKYHDAEIVSLGHFNENLHLILRDSTELIFENVEYWEFSPFEFQNVIFELNIFNINDVPEYVINEYEWIGNYKSKLDLLLAEIDSSNGLRGVIVYKDLIKKKYLHTMCK
jgi:hypothetical protein